MVATLLARPKTISPTARERSSPATASRHPDWEERRTRLSAAGEGTFIVIERPHRTDPQRFSIQLLYRDGDGAVHRLLRAGSKLLAHTNRLERQTITDGLRVNRLTERYQEAARQTAEIKEDGYAMSARDRFDDFTSARAYLSELASISFTSEEPSE